MCEPSRWAAVLVVLSVCLAASSARADRVEFRIDRVEVDDFVAKDELRFYIDLLDGDKNVVRDLDPDDIRIFVEGESSPLEGEVSVDRFQDLDEGMAVAIILAAHNAYVPMAVEEDEDEADGEQPRIPSPFKAQQKGVLEFLGGLGNYDLVGIFEYNEETIHVITPFSSDVPGARRLVSELDPRQKDTSRKAPRLFQFLRDVVENRIAEEDSLPRRRIVLLMSDGMHGVSNVKKLEGDLDRVAEAAKLEGVKIFAIGFSMGDTSHLRYLAQLCTATDGVYREVGPKDIETIPEVYKSIVEELRRQYVVTLKTEDLDGDEYYTFRMEIDAFGRTVAEKFRDDIRMPPKPYKWGRLLAIVGAALGGLLLIFLVFKLIQALLRRRAAAAAAAPEEYTGPSMGRLIATGGPYAGVEFHLVSETVTIGSMGKNDISLEGDDACSKRHAGIKIDGLRYELADFGSTNGTYVNGRRINKVFLKDGDQVRVGSTEFTFRMK